MIPRSACRASIRPSPVQSLPPVLPWLAPAQLRWLAAQPLSSADRKTRRSMARNGRLTTSRSRCIGTTQAHDTGSAHSDIPFDAGRALAGSFDTPEHGMWQGFNRGKSLLTPDRPRPAVVVAYDAALESEKTYKPALKNMKYTGLDMLQHLYTSLTVGRSDRARVIIQRLALDNPPDAPDLIQAHRIYLESASRSLREFDKRSIAARDAFDAMQSWFQKEIESKRVKIDAGHLVPLIRGALHSLEEQDCSDTVRRYVEIASRAGESVFEQVLFSEEFDDAEYSGLIATTSHYFEEGELPSTEDNPDPLIQDATSRSPQHNQVVDLNDLPHVRSTTPLSSGLQGVQDSVAALRELPALPLDASSDDQLQRDMDRQRLIEETAVTLAIKRWKEADDNLRKIGISTSLHTKPMSALMWQWYSALLPELEAELKACRDQPKRKSVDLELQADRAHYALFLETLPLPQLAANTILLVLSRLIAFRNDTDGLEVATTKLVIWLGRELENDANARTQKAERRGTTSANSLSLRKDARAAVRRRKSNSQSARVDTADVVDHSKPSVPFTSWPRVVQAKLGAMLVQKLMKTARLPVTRPDPRTGKPVTQLQPAFTHRTKYKRGSRTGLLCANPALVSKLESEPVGSLLAKYLPMIVKPVPWSAFDNGGYCYHQTGIIRLSSPRDGAKDHFQAADFRGNVDKVYQGLNVLSKVPWRINHDVFRVQLEAWNSGDAVANLAPLNLDITIPPEPTASADPEARHKWLRMVREAEHKKRGNHSERCFQNFQMEVARAMLNETLYFPHNLDFRGRAYPIPPHLNHMGADNVRALVVFADGKELGEDGLRWLKIHLANVAGYDKASLREREDFTMAHLHEIRDSARDPLGGNRWWLKSDDAWQTLAACYELVHALDSPDPSKFVSHLPIHQDGTCNGLQHYAALGGDKLGAALVNLEPGERPGDVYSGVAKAVTEAVERDAAAGHPIAKAVHGHVNRKVVKQTVMTNVYGVTDYGARAQVRKQLEDLLPDVNHLSAVDHLQMASYLVTTIFDSLGTMFTGAQAIQRWLELCAGRISTCVMPDQIDKLLREETQAAQPETETPTRTTSRKSGRPKLAKVSTTFNPAFKQSVIWTTPLSLPVVQPYRAPARKVISTRLQTVTIREPQMWDPVKRKKQMQAFPPNFIHSLDATHMLMTAIMCDEAGLTFASIHDSFWTHACDVPRMASILRDSFITMHSEDVIGRLKEEFEARYKGSLYRTPIPPHSPARKTIEIWRRQHRIHGGIAEFKLEAERMRLLQSMDAQDRLKGAQMVTPGSILEAAVASEDINHSGNSEMEDLHENVDGPAEDMLASFEGAEHGTEDGKVDTELGDVLVDEVISSAAKTRRDRPETSAVWLPLKFPAVPTKGDFDVTRVRDSEYFFH